MKHAPKFTLQMTHQSSYGYPYEILETAVIDGIGKSRLYAGRHTLIEALECLLAATNGPIVIAYSLEPMGNRFNTRED